MPDFRSSTEVFCFLSCFLARHSTTYRQSQDSAKLLDLHFLFHAA